MKEYHELHGFAVKYRSLYTDPRTTERQLEEGFADSCFGFGFEMDCGKAFIERFSEQAFYETEAFDEIIDNVDDVNLLGSAIFSKWRYLTHWSYMPDLTGDDSRKWFISAFSRLAELTADSDLYTTKAGRYSDSNSGIQVETEVIMLRIIREKLRDETLIKPDSIPLDTDGEVFICPDFYSEESKVIGEIHAHIGRLKGSQPDKIAGDVLKMLMFEEKRHVKYTKYIAVCDQEEYKQLKGKSALAEAIRVFGIELMFIDIPEDDYERLREGMRKQNLLK